MDSQSPSQTASPIATSKLINRRSLLKGSASVAVAFTAMGSLSAKAEAPLPAATPNHTLHPMDDFPGGI